MGMEGLDGPEDLEFGIETPSPSVLQSSNPWFVVGLVHLGPCLIPLPSSHGGSSLFLVS